MIADFDAASNSLLLHTSHHEKELVKQVPGAQWRDSIPNARTRSNGAWQCPASWPAHCALMGIFKHSMEPTETYTKWATSLWDSWTGPLTNLRFQPDADLGAGPTVARLWPLQRVAVQAMVWAEKYIEMDEMGGGKTATTLAALRMAAAIHGPEQVFPALVVCPNKVRRSWRKIALEELGDGQGPLWPDLRLEVLPKGKAAQKKLLAPFEDWNVRRDRLSETELPEVLVANWEALHTLSRIEKFGQIELSEKDKTPGPLNRIPWRTVVFDEVHRAKNRKARQTLAAKAIANGTPSEGTGPARFRWGLTGTLIANDAAEAWSILNLVYPEGFPAYTRFIDRYAHQVYNGYGGLEIGGLKPENADEYHAATLPFTIRRLREQFDPFKPIRTMQTLTVPMEPKQAKAYNDLSKTMLAELDNGVLTVTDAMHKANRLHRLAQSWGEMVDKGRRHPITNETILDLLLKAPSNKVKAMLELVEDFGITPRMEPGRSIVFGAHSRQLLGLCEAELQKAHIPYSLIAGGMSDSQQEQQERNFELGNTRVMLCVISAAKEGLNSLVKADTLVFLQKSWSRVDNEQFMARIDRPGQQAKKVTFIDVVSEGTIEEFEMTEKLDRKYANFQEIVQDARTLRTMLAFKGES